MSGGKASSAIAHVWPQLAHWQVMTLRLFTTSVQPLYWHLGQMIGSGQPVFGTAPKMWKRILTQSGKSLQVRLHVDVSRNRGARIHGASTGSHPRGAQAGITASFTRHDVEVPMTQLRVIG